MQKTDPGSADIRPLRNLALAGDVWLVTAVLLAIAGTITIAARLAGHTAWLPCIGRSGPMSFGSGLGYTLIAAQLAAVRHARPRLTVFIGCLIVSASAAVLVTPLAAGWMSEAAACGFLLWTCAALALVHFQTRSVLKAAIVASLCAVSLSGLSSLSLARNLLGDGTVEAPGWNGWWYQMSASSALLFLLLGALLTRSMMRALMAASPHRCTQVEVSFASVIGLSLFTIFVLVNLTVVRSLADSRVARAEITRQDAILQTVSGAVRNVRLADNAQRDYLLSHSAVDRAAFASALARLDASRRRGLSQHLQSLIGRKFDQLQSEAFGPIAGLPQTANSLAGLPLLEDIERTGLEEITRAQTSKRLELREDGAITGVIGRAIFLSYALAVLMFGSAAWVAVRELRRRKLVEQQLRFEERLLEDRVAQRTSELAASESRYRALLEQAPFAIHVLDRHGNSLGVNPAFENHFGVNTAALRNYNIWRDPQPANQGTIGLLKRAFAGEAGISHPIRHLPDASFGTPFAAARDTRPTTVEVYIYPVKSAAGEVEEVVLLCHDVTAREEALRQARESEANFRNLTDALPTIVWTADLNGVLDFYNERWYRFSGLPRNSKDWQSVLHSDDLPKCLARWEQAVKTQTTYACEFRLWDKERHSWRWYLSRAVPVLDANGQLQRWVGSTTDIHDKVEAEEWLEERVRQRTAQLKQSLLVRDTLLREVHHRVKNNLQIISSLLGMQSASLADQPAAAIALDEARRRVLSMSLIHERLYGDGEFNRVDFAEYAETLTRELAQSLSLPGTDVSAAVTAEPIELDLEQAIPCGLILNELLTNALKYAFRGRPSGQIHVGFCHRDGEVRLTVQDDGVGLPPDFDWRNAQSLGLPIIDILSRQLGGSVQLEALGGVKASITFPYQEQLAS